MPRQPAVGHRLVADRLHQSGVGMHLAVDFQPRRSRSDHRQRLPHLAGGLAVAGAETGVRHQRRLGRQAEAAHRLGRQQGHFGDLFGGRVDHHEGVANEQHAAGDDQAGQRINPVDVRPARDDRQDVLDLPPPRPGAAADRRVRLPVMQQHRRRHRRPGRRRGARLARAGCRGARPGADIPGSAGRTHPGRRPDRGSGPSAPRSIRRPISFTLAAITSRRPSRIGWAMPSSTRVWAARRMRSSSPSANTTRLGSRDGRLEHRAHQVAGAEHEPLQIALIGLEIGDRPARDPGLDRRAGDGGGDLQDQPRIERPSG